MFICGRQFTRSDVVEIQDIINIDSSLSRSQLSRDICEKFNLIGLNGRLQEVGCRVGLLKMYRAGLLQLPAAQERPGLQYHHKSTEELIPDLPKIECDFSGFGEITIEAIANRYRKESRIWKYLMDRFHYLGSGPLCGSQLRYLIHHERFGYIGGFAFSAASLRLEVRDRWIGWDDKIRKNNLHKVICNSRFLLVPQVKVKHLASHAISLCLKRLVKDWTDRYNIGPLLLETFVEQGRFKGTCYRASNWQHVGMTKGRGRQDRKKEFAVPVKDVYLYPLDKQAKQKLCHGQKMPVFKDVVSIDWVDEEFITVSLGDKRRSDRLKKISRDFWARPGANIPQACGSRAKTKAAYRFLEDKRNSMEKILQPHYDNTINRITKEKIVLAVQDTTILDYSTHPATNDLGLIGTRIGGSVGLIVHDTMCFNLEGTPLGLLDVQSWARDPADFGKKHLRKQLSIEQKESNKWLKSFEAIREAQQHCSNTTIVSVGDREADIYEFFHLALNREKGSKLLIRAEHNRLLADGQGHLHDYVSTCPLSGIQTIKVPRKKGQKARGANLEIRFAQVTLAPPSGKSKYGKLPIWVILAEEIDAPEGVTPLKWILLTTCEISGFDQAIEKLTWYTLRWGIEIYHRVLKSGCKIERRQLGSASRIESCLAIDMIVGWRIYHLTKLGREVPNNTCTVFFEDAEWKALVAYINEDPIPPPNPPKLRDAIHMVASLGGFLGRKCDGEPGTQTIWLGLQRLDDMTAMWKITMAKLAPEYLRPPPVSSNPKYG